MTYFFKTGNTFKPSAEENFDLRKCLPAGNYIIKEDQIGNLFLEQIDSFSFSGKRYGDNIKHTDRIFNTFLDRKQSTGVMLVGEKGSGKSLLAKNLSIKAFENDIPTIVINAAWTGDKFNSFIQSISQPCVVLFDEFEKVYDSNKQEEILTLLDGVFPSKKLFVFTSNCMHRIDSNMRNRPGRIYYFIEFKGLSVEFIKEYCNDNLQDKTHIENICKFSALFVEFNFDMLKAMVEEMNRYGESPQEVMSILNTKPYTGGVSQYTVSLISKGKTITEDQLLNKGWNGNPISSNFNIEYDLDPLDHNSTYQICAFMKNDLKSLNADEGKYNFINLEKDQLTLTRVKEQAFDYSSLF